MVEEWAAGQIGRPLNEVVRHPALVLTAQSLSPQSCSDDWSPLEGATVSLWTVTHRARVMKPDSVEVACRRHPRGIELAIRLGRFDTVHLSLFTFRPVCRILGRPCALPSPPAR